jgi:hypothetical protein
MRQRGAAKLGLGSNTTVLGHGGGEGKRGLDMACCGTLPARGARGGWLSELLMAVLRAWVDRVRPMRGTDGTATPAGMEQGRGSVIAVTLVPKAGAEMLKDAQMQPRKPRSPASRHTTP